MIHREVSSKGIHKGNAGEIKPLARTFLETYQAAAVKTDEDFRRVISGHGGYQHFEGGLVELTDQVRDATDALVDKAIKMIGPKGASERALTALAEEVGKDLIRGDLDLEGAVTKLIEKFSQESNSSFELILPNYLIDFTEGVRSVEMGRVRAALTEDVSAEVSQRGIPVTISQGPELSQSIRGGSLALTMPPRCWVVIQLSDAVVVDGQDRTLTVPWISPSPYQRREIVQGEDEPHAPIRPMRVRARAVFAESLSNAHRWLNELIMNPNQTIELIAARENKSERSIRMILTLSFVAPPIVAAAVEGRLPRGFGVKRLMDLPTGWSQQWTALGLKAPART
jgi:hypothetical protein